VLDSTTCQSQFSCPSNNSPFSCWWKNSHYLECRSAKPISQVPKCYNFWRYEPKIQK
jgi:hypothetical protein